MPIICSLAIPKKGKRKVQGVPQSQTAALPRPQEEEETTNLNKQKPNKRTKSTKISSLFPKRGNRNTKRTEKHKNKLTHGKSMHIASLDKIPCYLLKLSSGNENMGVSRADNSVKNWRKCPLAISNQIFTISMHILSLVKIHWCLLKLSYGNEKRTDGRTTDGHTDGHTDVQRETIIPRHYCLAGIKKRKKGRLTPTCTSLLSSQDLKTVYCLYIHYFNLAECTWRRADAWSSEIMTVHVLVRTFTVHVRHQVRFRLQKFQMND